MYIIYSLSRLSILVNCLRNIEINDSETKIVLMETKKFLTLINNSYNKEKHSFFSEIVI